MKNEERLYFVSMIIKTLVMIFILWGFVFISVKVNNFNDDVFKEKYSLIKYGNRDIIGNLNPSMVYDTKNKVIIYFDSKGNQLLGIDSELPYHFMVGDFYIFPFTGEIGKKIDSEIFIINIFTGFFRTFYVFLLFLPFFIIWAIVIFSNYTKIKNEETIYKISRAENTAGHQSLTILTENLHHELNTPLTVIEGKIKRIEHNVLKLLNASYEKSYDTFADLTDDEISKISPELKIKRIKEDKEYLELSLEQIRGILENMREFKMLRHSNGNKTFYDLLKGSANTLRISIGGLFDISVDRRLKEYRILHDSGFKNADLINAVINHVKNSYEANAESISFTFEKYTEGLLCFLIIDNGNGIDEKHQKHIFEPNTSSKSDKLGHIRGNGMFLNKKILENFGGVVELVESEEGTGTTFRLCIPAEKV